MKLSGRNRDVIGSLDIFKQKQKGLRYIVIFQRLISRQLKGFTK